jgi:bile acid:Na+ symporter, BASS family
MTLAELIPLVLKISVVAIVFAIGLHARPADLLFLVKRPGQLARSLLSMTVLMPLVAFALVRAMSLPHPVAIMLVALSLAPVPPLLPRRQAKAHGHAAYSISLLVAAGLVSLVWIPLAIEVDQRLFGVPLGVPLTAVAMLVGMTILGPLAVGIVVGLLAPGLAARIAQILSILGMLLLVAASGVILASQWRLMGDLIGDGTLLAMALFIIAGLTIGHLLGGPDPDDRTVLAMATASRHPAIALAIAHINFPGEKAVITAVLLFLIANVVICAPYVAWRKRAGATADLALT